MRRIILALLSAILASSGQINAAAPAKPNIIVVLVDDMGFSDLGCYGSEIPTPNLDALAKDGLKFTQFYNVGRCCPSRASLLTGLYPHQAGVGYMMRNQGQPGYLGHLNDQCVTIAEVLKPAGYFTAMTGKWHVGQEQGVTPWGRGYDRNLSAPDGGFFFPESKKAKLFLNGKEIANNDPQLPPNWYSTDLWTTFGLKFIEEAVAEKKPFYLHLCYNAPHFPLQVPAEEVAKFRGKYAEGWDKLRLSRHAKQIQLGLVEKEWPLAPRMDDIAAWDSLSKEDKDRFDSIMAVYAAVLAHMDRAVGDLVAGLKKQGVYENTLIMFMSDNGGNAETGPKGKNKGDPSDADSSWFCGESWASLQNTPFRYYKHFNHEGGISTPLIVHWPAGIKAKGEIRTQPGHLIDIMPTCVEVGGATYPKTFKGQPIKPMEGRSLVGAFSNQPIAREALFWEHQGNAAVRVGDMKLVRVGGNSPWELYDLSKDRTETLNNLAAKEPERAKELAAKWEAWAKRANVMLSGGKKGKGKKNADAEESD